MGPNHPNHQANIITEVHPHEKEKAKPSRSSLSSSSSGASHPQHSIDRKQLADT